MQDKNSYDVRKATCQGGGGLWAFLSHVRDVRRGESLELTTDDVLATADIPAWTQKIGWKLERGAADGAETFIAQRPA